MKQKFKYVVAYLTLIALLISCDNNQHSTKNSNLENVNSNEETNLTGFKLIDVIEFEVRVDEEDKEIFKDGIIPWISIENPQEEINRLIDADKIVINEPEITLYIDYPLENPVKFIIKSNVDGFTKKQLALEISEKYHELYSKEEKTAQVKTIPKDKRNGVINRNQTDGKYGIWGHDISDLDLNSIEVYKNPDGKIQISLFIES
ncbi:MAG: hypothetical protein ACK476_10725 [Fluviicola sp.]